MSDLKHFVNLKKFAMTVKRTFPHRKKDILFNLSENHRGDSSFADPDAVFFDPWVWEGKKIRVGIRDEHPRSYFRELKTIFWVKNI
jgi:hypothetical protein